MISNLKVKSKCGTHVQALSEAQASVIAPLTQQVITRTKFNELAIQMLNDAGLPVAKVINASFGINGGR
jgi:hypothetical protein